MTRIVIMGGGPAGYEAALVAVQFGATVTLVERDGIGGACVLTDCVPSKTFIASAGGRTAVREAPSLGVMLDPDKVRGRRRGGARPGRTGWRWPSPSTSVPGWSPMASRSSMARRFWPIGAGAGCSRRRRARGGRHGQRTHRGRRADRHRCLPADPARRRTGRRADPDLAAGVRAAEAARAPDRGRVGGDRRGVRLRLHGDGRPGDAGVQPGPGAAQRGRGRRGGDRGGLLRRAAACWPSGPGRSVARERRRRAGHPEDGREVRGQPRADDGRGGAQHRGIGLERVGVRAGQRRLHRGGPGVPDLGVRHLRRRGLHRRADAGLGGRHAGPDRDVARAGRGGAPLRLKTVSANVFTHPEIATVGYSQAEAEAGRYRPTC